MLKRLLSAFLILLLSASLAFGTVADSTSRIAYNCNGSTTAFAFTFGVGATSEIQVILTTSAGVETVLTETTHYTVTCVNDDCESGGTVTTVSTYASGNTITILRSVDITQESDFVENQATLYETFEDGLDKLTRIAQQQKEEIDRAPKLAKSSDYAGTDYTFPDPNASKLIGWNATATDLTTFTASSGNISIDTLYQISDYGNNIATAVTSLGATEATLLIDVAAAGDTTVPDNIHLFFLRGGSLTGTVELPFADQNWPKQQIFSATASVSFTTKDSASYSEWWGIDGTADDVQINAALTAAGHVKLLGNKSYDISAVINGVSNGSLIGEGESTLLTGSGASHNIFTLSGKSDFKIDNLKIAATAVTTACYGIRIENSLRVNVGRIYFDDCISGAVIVTATGGSSLTSDIRLRDLWIVNDNDAAGSRAIQITCEASSDANVIRRVSVKNVYINGFDVANTTLITNNANIAAGTSDNNVADNIFWENLVISTTGDHNGFGGSAGVSNLHLNNFDIGGATVASSTYGILLETISNFSVTNGAVHGQNIGLAIIPAIAGGAKKGQIQNVEAYGAANDGFQFGQTADGGYNIVDTDVINCKAHDNGNDGFIFLFTENMKVIGNVAYDNTTGSGFMFSSGAAKDNDNIYIAGNIAYKTAAGTQALGFTIGQSIEDGIFLGNRAYDNTADISYQDEADIKGEQETVYIGTLGATADATHVIHVSPGQTGSVLQDVLLIDRAGVAAHATDIRLFTVADDAGDSISVISTDSDTYNVSLTANVPYSFNGGNDFDADNILTNGQKATLAITHGANGAALTDFKAVVRYITY